MQNNEFILVALILFILIFIVLVYNKTERFSNMLEKEKYSSDVLINFCEKLHQLDDNENADTYTNEYYNKQLKDNEDKIKLLKETIETLNNQIVNIDVAQINKFRKETDANARQQIKLLDETVDKINNRNNVYIDLDGN